MMAYVVMYLLNHLGFARANVKRCVHMGTFNIGCCEWVYLWECVSLNSRTNNFVISQCKLKNT